MPKELLINVSEGEECRIALVEDGRLEELYIERTSSTSHVGNIYKGKVTNVEASIQAAFIDFGLGRNGFLHVSDLLPEYFGKKGEDVEEYVGKKMARRDRPPIQRCLRRGDEITVQVIKEGIGTKGPTLSSYLSVSGKMLVMMPGVSGRGVSRKIEDEQERRRLKQILDSLDPPEDCGFIIRTEAVGKSKADIERDLKYLARLWEQMKEKRDSSKGTVELYTEGDLVTRTIRDVFSTDVDRVIADSVEVAERVREVVRLTSPRTKDKVEAYEGAIPLFHKFGIERDIELMYSRHVPLPSGGSLVIDSTEAIVAIDVNSGKFREHADAETTAFKTDMEAADEICRQLKLRDLGGVIICDFIDLRFERHRRELEERIVANFRKDRAKTRVLRMSQFGIIEITRQRMRPSLKRSVYFDCPHCKGAGLVKTPESMSLDVMRRLAIAMNDTKVVRAELAVCADIAFYLSNKKRWALADLEDRTGKRVVLKLDQSLGLDEMRLDLFDNRDGLILLPELSEALAHHPHTSQLHTRAAGRSGGQGRRGGRPQQGDRRPQDRRDGRGREDREREERERELADDRFEMEGGDAEGQASAERAEDAGDQDNRGERSRDDRRDGGRRDQRSSPQEDTRDDRKRDGRNREDRSRDDRGREERPREDRGRGERQSRDDRSRDDRSREDQPRGDRQRNDRDDRQRDPRADREGGRRQRDGAQDERSRENAPRDDRDREGRDRDREGRDSEGRDREGRDRQDRNRQGRGREGDARDERSRGDRGAREGRGRDDRNQDDRNRDDRSRDDRNKDDRNRGDRGRDERGRNDRNRDDRSRENRNRGDAVGDDRDKDRQAGDAQIEAGAGDASTDNGQGEGGEGGSRRRRRRRRRGRGGRGQSQQPLSALGGYPDDETPGAEGVREPGDYAETDAEDEAPDLEAFERDFEADEGPFTAESLNPSMPGADEDELGPAPEAIDDGDDAATESRPHGADESEEPTDDADAAIAEEPSETDDEEGGETAADIDEAAVAGESGIGAGDSSEPVGGPDETSASDDESAEGAEAGGRKSARPKRSRAAKAAGAKKAGRASKPASKSASGKAPAAKAARKRGTPKKSAKSGDAKASSRSGEEGGSVTRIADEAPTTSARRRGDRHLVTESETEIESESATRVPPPTSRRPSSARDLDAIPEDFD